MKQEKAVLPKLMRADEIYLSVNELSQLTGFGFPTVKKRLEGISSTQGPYAATVFCLKDAIPAIFAQQDDSIVELKLKREREETRLATARSRKIELENAVKEKILIPIEEAEREYAELIVNFKSRMLSIPSRAAFELLRFKDPSGIETHLNLLISEALNELTRNAKRETADSCEAPASTYD